MMNLKDSKMAKVVSGLVGLSTALMMMGPAVASAATVAELTAQINALMAQVQSLQSAQGATSAAAATAGHVFSADLTLGSKGDDVTALQGVLVAKGYLVMPAGVAMGYFGGLTKSALAKWQAASGISPAAGYFGPKSRAAVNAMGASTTTTTTTTVPTTTTTTTTTGQPAVTGTVTSGSGLSVMLDASSPSAHTLIAGQAVATLAIYKFSNPGSVPAKVTSIKLKRTGISSDSTVSNIYLYSGTSRITDAASISLGVVNFNDSGGIITIPAASYVLVAVRADIAASTNGQSIGVLLTDVVSDAGAVSGLPIQGSEDQIAALPSGATAVDFSATVNPSATGNVDPQMDFRAYQTTVTISNRDALMSSFRLRQIGSVSAGDLKNFRLLIDGVQVGSAVDQVSAGGYVTFSFPTPVALKAGARDFKVLVDIIGGSNRTFELSLRQAGDVEIADSQLGFTVLPTVASASFSAPTTYTQTVTQGTITITKASDSLSGNVVNSGSGVTLGKFTMKAQGEEMKVENLRVSFSHSNGGTTAASNVGKLRNGALFANGVQIGSTADINEDSLATAYTQFNLGSSLIVVPGKDVTLEVRADVYDNDGTNNMTAADTFTMNIAAGSSNIQRRTSLSYIANTAVSANQLTVATGSLTLSKYTAFADQTVVVPQTAYKIGEYRLSGGATEAVNLTSLNIDMSGTTGVDNLSNVYLVYGDQTSAVKSAVASSSNSWSINKVLGVSQTLPIAVYATLGSNTGSTQTIITKLTVNGTAQSSAATANSSQITGQTITAGTATLSVALDGSNPGASLVVGNSVAQVASWKFTASNDSFTVDELTATTTTNGATAIGELIFKDHASGTELGRQSFNGVIATITGLSIKVPFNGTKVVDVFANLGSIGTGAATSTAQISVALHSYEKLTSAGVKSRVYINNNSDVTVSLAGNAILAVKTKPTITNESLPTTILAAGTMTVAKFTITADPAGTIAWRKLIIAFATSTPSGTLYLATTTYNIYDAANPSTALTGVTSSVAATGASPVTFTSSIDQEVSGSKTYVVKVQILGAPATGASVSHNIATGQTANVVPDTYTQTAALSPTATFVWSDEALVGHSNLTGDWHGDWLVKNLPTDQQTLQK